MDLGDKGVHRYGVLSNASGCKAGGRGPSRTAWRTAAITGLLAAALSLSSAQAAESGSATDNTDAPFATTDSASRGWFGRISAQPWTKELASMWTGEETDETDEVINPRVAALLSIIKRGNLFQVFHRGGPIMWPLLCAALLSLCTVLERAGFFTWERIRRRASDRNRLMKALREGQIEDAITIGRRSGCFDARVIGYALSHRGPELEGAIQYAKEEELLRYRRGIAMLDTVITLAPLLGLLGTVTGMMASFSLIGGELGAPGAITGGIAEALIATAFGLGIAITSLIPFNLMNQRLEEAGNQIDEAASTMLMLLKSRGADAWRASVVREQAGVTC